MGMKKWVLLMAVLYLSGTAKAQSPGFIAEIIKAGIVKVIKAVDLKIQRLQNETIWLQNAQKAIENTLSELKLSEIADWVEKQRVLYADYFDELHKVRSVIAYYRKIKNITERQVKIVGQYKRAYALFREDDHFTAEEILHMEKVYTGIFDESLKSLDRLFMVVNSFSTTMTDAERLVIIDEVSNNIDQNYFDLQAFNDQNKLLSLQRSKSEQEISTTKALYGIE